MVSRSRWLAVVVALGTAVATACGGARPVATPEPAPPAPPTTNPVAAPTPAAPTPVKLAPVKLAPAELVAAYHACWKGWVAKDAAKVTTCWGARGSDTLVDAGSPTIGGKAIAASAEWFWSTNPGLAGGALLFLARGNKVAYVTWLGGTQAAPNATTPGAGKRWGGVSGGVVELDDDGTIKATSAYVNLLTTLVQLGVVPGRTARPVVSTGPAEPTIVIAAGTETEPANEAAWKGLVDAWNRHDAKAVDALLAKDVLWGDQLLAKDLKGKAPALAYLKEHWKAFPDGKVESTSVWSAGDYVVAEGTFLGNHKAPSRSLGLAKATERLVSVRQLHIAKLAGGKVTELWAFTNGHAMALQLGIVSAGPPPAQP